LDALRCAADDVLPVALEDGAAWALPRFPQLKYRLDQQPSKALPSRLPLTQIFVLHSSSGQGDPVSPPLDPQKGAVVIEPLDGLAAVLALVRHTVAARLFTEDLLRRHVEFCARLVERIEVSRLHYPRRWDALPRVREKLFSQAPRCGAQC
jgi:hypothetical protein